MPDDQVDYIDASCYPVDVVTQLMMLSSWCYCPVDDISQMILSSWWWHRVTYQKIKNTLIVKGECWNSVTAKSILFIIDLLFIISIPFCGLIMSVIVIDQIPLANWSNHNCNMKIKKSTPAKIKVVLTTQKDKLALSVERHILSALASLYK